jgi:YhcH/YjgK/YiaL family protein
VILDALGTWEQYSQLHPRFGDAFRFLADPGLDHLPDGRVDIDGDKLYAIVLREKGKGKDAAQMEVHRDYIDIQFTVAGADLIGWAAQTSCRGREQGYDAAKDVEFFSGPPDLWVRVPQGHFALFYPADAHAPLATEDTVHKVVVKIAVD